MRTTRSESARPGIRPAAAYRVQSVERAAALLRAVADSPSPATVWELARACELNRSTAWRILSTLEAHGLVERDPTSQRYTVGYAALQMAAAADYDPLARRLRPILERVAEETGEIVSLVAARRFSLVYVDQADPPGAPVPSWLGRPIPLHATSSGKVFLAWLDPEELEAVLPATLDRFTSATITDRAALVESLGAIRRDGYSTCLSEFEEFSNGVSAAVFDRRTRPVVIINIFGPSQRVTRRRLPALGRVALRAAHEMSAVLG
jgi:DNA-binding IclR family transcriptional regulator